MSHTEEETHLLGVPISEGIAIGPMHFLTSDEEDCPKYSITAQDVDREISRYREALSSSKQDLNHMLSYLVNEGSEDAAHLIDAHIQMLEDPLMNETVEEQIRHELQNTESVFQNLMRNIERRFLEIEDPTFQDRSSDVKGLFNRVLKHLNKSEQVDFKALPEKTVLVTKELIPTDTVEAVTAKICGIVTEVGGKTSHTALIAQARGIPFVSKISVERLEDLSGKMIIVDGYGGEVIVDPSAETLEIYREKQKERQREYIHFVENAHLDAKTQDGCPIEILANIESISETELLEFYKIDGIGLLRSEFLFMDRDIESLTEEEEFTKYRNVLQAAGKRPVVFRLFDIGGDKGGTLHSLMEEANPALGCRAIRFLFEKKEIFTRQIRALLRASLFGDMRLLLPLITDVDELLTAKRLIEKIADTLREEGLDIPKLPPFGCMVEVPSAVLCADVLAVESDFFSIGTNDLVQYTLAADRSNHELYSRYSPAHLSTLRMIKRVVREGRRNAIPVGLCGEMASNPLLTKLLIGLGVRQFSCSTRWVPEIKDRIRRTSLAEAKDLAERVLNSKRTSEIEELLKSEG